MTELPAPLLEVVVAHQHDVPGAQEGGADRLLLAVGSTDGQRSPETATASAVLRAADVPVRVVLRLGDGFGTSGEELARLAVLAEEYLTMGAEGVAFGFLDTDLRLDRESCAVLADRLAGVPWTFHGAFDLALDPQRAWRDVRGLPGLTAVCSAGSSRGLTAGGDALIDLATRDLDVAELLLPGGELVAEQVPWLARAGVHQFQLGSQARPGGSPKAYVDAALVRSWRLLVDDSRRRVG